MGTRFGPNRPAADMENLNLGCFLRIFGNILRNIGEFLRNFGEIGSLLEED